MTHRRLAAAALLLAACGGTSQTPPPSSPPPASAGTATLPSGHPPLSGDLPVGHPPLANTEPADPARSISGTVTLAPALSGTAGPGWTLYVIARGGDGQVQAVRRFDGVPFPAAFQLSAADAMNEGAPFSGPFDVTARLSKTGDAMPAAGDLEGTARGIRLGAKDARIVIDTVRK